MEQQSDNWTIEINYEGQQGTYPWPVAESATDKQILDWAWEAISHGDVTGISTVSRDLSGYKVSRKYNDKIFLVRPEVKFG